MLNLFLESSSLNLSFIREASPWQIFKDTPVMKDYWVCILPAARCQNRTRDNWVGSSNATSVPQIYHSQVLDLSSVWSDFFFDPGWRVFFFIWLKWVGLTFVTFAFTTWISSDKADLSFCGSSSLSFTSAALESFTTSSWHLLKNLLRRRTRMSSSSKT